ncbi:MAG: IspD/TarI family cytidylyltransferase [Paraclostridium sp.]|uniref:IspD/TarI family cytidylyltransferase n=1 Tax=Paraclostridium sp. TaxID=2023273 RepID=UPI003F3EDAE9
MIYAEILAGGKGTRMGKTEMPKQFLNIGKKPIIIHTIDRFLLNNKIDKIIVITPKEWIAHTKDIVNKYILKSNRHKILICEGGKDRNESIMNGIEYIASEFGLNSDDIVITHDAVRPFLTHRIIEENIEMAIKYGATDTVIPATDTIVESVDGQNISNIPVRSEMYQGQTPQSFNIQKLQQLYKGLSKDEKNILTDASKIFVVKNQTVKLVMGDVSNIKITTQYDLKVANAMLSGEII